LSLREFGYRSVHLIARLKPDQMRITGDDFLREHWFEIQVRSVLEHAWAEIEHEVVYKSGIRQPDTVLRRFAALAGSLEVFDREFLALREERKSLIARYSDIYRQNKDQRKSFDVARLLAFLEATRTGLSWRQAEEEGRPFAAHLENSCVDALRAAGIGTPASLRRVLHSPRFRYALRSFAASEGIAPSDVSHLATVVLAVVVKNVNIVRHHFPNLIYDPSLASFVERRIR
jgi:Region found in RelA / SpoT proteins